MKAVMKTTGMSCAACSARIDRELAKVAGVRSVHADFADNKVTVEYDGDVLKESDIAAAIRKLGYGTLEGDEEAISEARRKETASLRKGLIVSAIFTAALMFFAMGPMFGLILPLSDSPILYSLLQLALCIPVLISGRRFYIRGIPALFRRSPTMDTLVAVGTMVAVLYSLFSTYMISAGSGTLHSLYYDSAAMIIALVSVGKYMEAGSLVKTDDTLRGLARMAPDTAFVERGGAILEIPASDVVIGDVAVVKPGEKVSVDGIVIDGETYIDESMLTGESMPVLKNSGSHVFCGTLNTSGSIRVKVTEVGGETALSKIMQMVRDARGSKAPVSRVADGVAAVFVPVVIIIAASAGLLWFAAGRGFEFSLVTFISVLVISCPCALGLATPMAITVGTGRSAEFGILFRTAAALEMSGRISHMVLDKTGTLTEGRPRVTGVSSEIDVEEFIYLIATAESRSEHPIARAITAHAESAGVKIGATDVFEAVIGKGIMCRIDGKDILVGNANLLMEHDIDVGEACGTTCVYMAVDGNFVGSVSISDPVRPESAEAVAILHRMGIETVMVTGDSRAAAESVATEVGIKDVIHGALPEDKVAAIKTRQAKGADVAVAGDGINDSPALTQSDLGIAVSKGTDIAMDSADVVLLNDDVRNIPAVMHIGRNVLKNIKQNLFFAFCYNAVCIPVAAGLPVLLGAAEFPQMPMLAALAMSLSSVSVVSNALRLRRMTLPYDVARSCNACLSGGGGS